MPHFESYIGIDYSGTETPESSCKGLRVYAAEGSGTPEQVLLPIAPHWFWTRRVSLNGFAKNSAVTLRPLLASTTASLSPLHISSAMGSRRTDRTSWRISSGTGRPMNGMTI
jgi:hypothetical protein